MKREIDFDWYLKTKNDVICNAAYELIKAITSKSTPPRSFEFSIPPRDEKMIRTLVEYAITAIDEQLGYTCRPFYQEDQAPCFKGSWCDNPHCIFKTADQQESPTAADTAGPAKGGESDG